VYKEEKQSTENRAVWMSIVFVAVDNGGLAITKYPKDKFCTFRTVACSFTATNNAFYVIIHKPPNYETEQNPTYGQQCIAFFRPD